MDLKGSVIRRLTCKSTFNVLSNIYIYSIICKTLYFDAQLTVASTIHSKINEKYSQACNINCLRENEN